jgi:hypothetical protein
VAQVVEGACCQPRPRVFQIPVLKKKDICFFKRKAGVKNNSYNSNFA